MRSPSAAAASLSLPLWLMKMSAIHDPLGLPTSWSGLGHEFDAPRPSQASSGVARLTLESSLSRHRLDRSILPNLSQHNVAGWAGGMNWFTLANKPPRRAIRARLAPHPNAPSVDCGTVHA